MKEMRLFVYGTLKQGFHNNLFLKDCQLIKYMKLKHHALVDLGHGFPYMIESQQREYVYGELYRVNRGVLKKIDVLEGVPNLYERKYTILVNKDDEEIYTYYYVSKMKDISHLKVKYNYWPLPNDNKRIFKVIFEDRKYEDTADKIVFHMRFFDGDRAPTNKDYMKLVKARSHLPINTENENLFLLDCFHYDIVKNII